jgi:predicted regulator of Ras-like GTPase activity (Roadblock/LC7/MglB family)
MTIPFLDLFKKIAGRFSSTESEEQSGPAMAARAPRKPASEKLSKTVLPHATRSFAPPDPFRSAAAVGPGRTSGTPMQLGPQRIISAPKKTQSTNLPPALARALEPKLERTVSLRIADFIDRIPVGYIKPVEILDSAARVSLKASEIEKGMPEKNPTISLPSLYQQVPEIFLKGVRPDDETRVALPYDKVLEQFSSAHVRADQMRDAAVPQLDTPILKATIQDSEKFGTKIEPIEASSLPPVPVKHATAEAFAAAEPEAIVQGTTGKPTTSGYPVVSLYSPELKSKSEPPTPQRKIPFELSPNGTGASATERVPASSGPPVPTPLPFTPELEKIAFQPSAPKTPAPLKLAGVPEATSEKPEPKQKPAEPAIAKPAEKPSVAKDETPIKLSLKAVLKNLPAFQLDGDITKVSDDAQVTLPLSLVESQLASGRISIAPDVFQKGLPESYRQFFQIDEAKTPVVLPLEEVLKNLPATILKLRDDQEHVALDNDFETPFSIKAKEDARRFAPEKKPEEKVSEKTAEETATEAKIDKAPAAEEKIDPKEIVAQANKLAGVKACAITFSDGLSLAGELPGDVAAEGLCAMAPAIMARITQHVGETKLGSLVAVTLNTTGSAVSFFAQGNICLTALCAGDSLSPETRKELAALTEKLSKHYAKTE